jgi:hypothetical protein
MAFPYTITSCTNFLLVRVDRNEQNDGTVDRFPLNSVLDCNQLSTPFVAQNPETDARFGFTIVKLTASWGTGSERISLETAKRLSIGNNLTIASAKGSRRNVNSHS